MRLLTETQRLAEALGLPADLERDSEEAVDVADDADPTAGGWRRYGIEAYVCLVLIEAAKLSVSTGAAIAFVQADRASSFLVGLLQRCWADLRMVVVPGEVLGCVR
ncbi:hypothetical protein [Amycolatopsis sp. w19]|uniref:hypothetical protein n=1 Tax=Amycolatopsis sp. w19 TaxID=3448134 RepID=UPI003F1A7B26